MKRRGAERRSARRGCHEESYVNLHDDDTTKHVKQDEVSKQDEDDGEGATGCQAQVIQIPLQVCPAKTSKTDKKTCARARAHPRWRERRNSAISGKTVILPPFKTIFAFVSFICI